MKDWNVGVDGIKCRIAAASSDGIVVNSHFGRAERFYIVDIEENGQAKVVEERTFAPVCEAGSHDDARMAETVDRLADCDYVLVSKIGPGAVGALERRGIGAYELPGMIDESVNKMAAYAAVQNLF